MNTMPGLCAILSDKIISKSLFISMIRSLKHEDFHIVDKFYSKHFACARIHLGIFNPKKQPLFNKDKSICVMMDGKIYGHSELNDLVYCLKSYENYGIDFIPNLNGNFILLIQDFRERKTIIANDRFAFRTHYYAMQNGSFYLAPEPKAILQDATFRREIDDEGIISFLSFGDFFGGRTLFRGIRTIEPASIILFDGDKISTTKYWRFTYQSDYSKTDDELVNELITSFRHAVKIRIQDNLRYSVTLSGGLDSRTVLSTCVLERRNGINAITWGNQECNETKIAKQVTKKLGIKNHMLIDITPELVLQYAEKEVLLSDGHSYVGEGYAYPVIRESKKSTDVILDGFALDITLGGSYLTPNKVFFKGTDSDYLNILLRSKPYVRYFYANDNLKQLLTPEYYEKVKDIPLRLFNEEYTNIQSKEYGNKCDEFAMNVHMAYTQVGDITVRNFVEVTHPTADNNFVTVLLTIPPEKRLHHMLYRKFLKKIAPEMAKIPYNKTMARPDLPIFLWNFFSKYNTAKVILRNKIRKYTRGHLCSKENKSYVNFYQWFQTNIDWQRFFYKVLVENSPINNLFNSEYVYRLLEEQINGEKDNVSKLLYLATIYIFLKNIFGEEKT